MTRRTLADRIHQAEIANREAAQLRIHDSSHSRFNHREINGVHRATAARSLRF